MLLRYWTVNHENCHIDKKLKKNVHQDIKLNN